MPKIGRRIEDMRTHGMLLGSGDLLAKRGRGVVETMSGLPSFTAATAADCP